LNGPWDSGKSSAVNLVLHHLKETDSEGIAVINFACWWFRGEEQLALAFFRELYAGLGASLGERFKNLLPRIGARLLRAGAVVGPAVDLAGAPAAGTLAAGAMNWLSGLIQLEDNSTRRMMPRLRRFSVSMLAVPISTSMRPPLHRNIRHKSPTLAGARRAASITRSRLAASMEASNEFTILNTVLISV
jgi:hypothetical protein